MKPVDAKLSRSEAALALTIGFYLQLAVAIVLGLTQGLTPASLGTALGACVLGIAMRLVGRTRRA